MRLPAPPMSRRVLRAHPPVSLMLAMLALCCLAPAAAQASSSGGASVGSANSTTTPAVVTPPSVPSPASAPVAATPVAAPAAVVNAPIATASVAGKKPRSVNKSQLKHAQILLRLPPTGTHDPATRAVIRRFQRLRGLPPFGIVDM